ncbi:hypothetical protein K3495_g8727 [Podosphaera aphanis]|nr:hypothetical protein K3495_g8727 [Podosphaera aphanis]
MLSSPRRQTTDARSRHVLPVPAAGSTRDDAAAAYTGVEEPGAVSGTRDAVDGAAPDCVACNFGDPVCVSCGGETDVRRVLSRETRSGTPTNGHARPTHRSLFVPIRHGSPMSMGCGRTAPRDWQIHLATPFHLARRSGACTAGVAPSEHCHVGRKQRRKR